ncbi:MAG: class I tRNA ligase family protein [Anaerolineales bacterium]|nr:class I tRNA ligase family protein [Anaerolineales bacterium]
MAFKPVPNKVDFVAQEHEVLSFWKETNAFEKLRALRKGSPPWSFIDGPITANNPMGVHHGWGRTYKDLYNRFWAMNGRELRYQNGFDCQGLWVEVEVEKEKGFKSKLDIEAYGLDAFVKECKARVLRYAGVQTQQSIRLGYWMEWNDPEKLEWLAAKLLEDPLQVATFTGPNGKTVTDTVEQVIGQLGLAQLGGSYFTFSNENNYMIWKMIKKSWEKGWLYRGADVIPWCPRCATGISQHEIVTDGYMELTHRSVTLRFPLRTAAGEARMEKGLPESLLVWTTTPWTLTSNVAAAVGPKLDYVKVKNGDHILYLSKGTLHMLRGDYQVLGELNGAEMEGWQYAGPFDELPAANTPGGVTFLQELIEGIEATAANTHQVILWEEVGESEGTGIVHIAPGCGAEDYQLGKDYHFPLLAPVEDEGYFVEGFGWLTGMHVSEVADPIFENLEEKGILYLIEPYTHRYPTCWRCKTELVFRLVDEWFISMGELYDKPREQVTAQEKKNSLRYQIMDVVDQIRWIPEFGHKRELDWLRNMHDWMVSKKRYWGLALPIWICEDCGHYHVMGDEHEMEERAIEGWDQFKGHTPHRPFIDKIKIACDKCGGKMSRIPDVGNPWLDAGIVSFSTLGYRDDPDFWRKWYPAHWISESFPGQFRNWFYSLLAMATVLDGTPPFLQNFGYASLLAEDGREMHKSWGNAIEFNEAADKMGVDVMRWLYCSHKPENNLLFGYNRAEETRRRFLIPLWNVYSFFSTYASLDGWLPTLAEPFDPGRPEGSTPESMNPLDQWILARLNQVVAEVSEDFENSDAYTATLAFEALMDDVSNWYVRRSRRRFWKSEHDNDKNTAYATLWHLLVKMTRALAPVLPFVSEVMYQNLVRGAAPDAHESVHHTDWPAADLEAVDEKLITQMGLARRVASLGLSARSNADLKVRQPLSKVLVYVSEGQAELSDDLVAIVSDELNVKRFEFTPDAGTLVSYRVLPVNKVLGPRFGADFPKVRAALSALDPNQVAASVEAGESIQVEFEGQPHLLTPEEVLVNSEPAEGLAVATDKFLSVAVDTVLTPELKSEGLAREIVRRVQAQRKNADFNIEDRITTWYLADDELVEVFQTWGVYIQAETLTTELVDGEAPKGAFVETHTVEGMKFTIGVKQQ